MLSFISGNFFERKPILTVEQVGDVLVRRLRRNENGRGSDRHRQEKFRKFHGIRQLFTAI